MAPDVVDPVCGEIFPASMADFKSRHDGKTFHFCSSTCKEEFDADPDAFPELDPLEE